LSYWKYLGQSVPEIRLYSVSLKIIKKQIKAENTGVRKRRKYYKLQLKQIMVEMEIVIKAKYTMTKIFIRQELVNIIEFQNINQNDVKLFNGKFYVKAKK
jgi:hypothetical protein